MSKKRWIQDAIKKPGAFTKQAKAAGMSPLQFAGQVLSGDARANGATKKRAVLAKTLSKMRKG